MDARTIVIFLFITICFLGCGEDAKNPAEEYGDNLINALDKAEKTTLTVNLKLIRMEIDRFKAEKGRYPKTLAELKLPNIAPRHYQYDPATGEVAIK